MKKVLLLVVVFVLAIQVAVAAGPLAAGPRPGVGNMMRLYFGELRLGLNAMPNAPYMRGRMRLARERLDDLEELAQSDPAALAARMLERHDAMVAKAREIVANKATLPSQIVADLKAVQARVLAQVERNAEQIAGKQKGRSLLLHRSLPSLASRWRKALTVRCQTNTVSRAIAGR